MKQIVLVRYGEIALKSEPVRKKFKKLLIRNIKSSLHEIPFEIKKERGRIFIETPKPNKVASKVANLPGVVSTSPTWGTKASIESICELAVKTAQEAFPSTGSFAVRGRRVGDHKFTSKDIEEEVGAEILKKNPDLNVNLDSPDYKINVEVRKNKAYVFTNKIKGTGGLPVGSQGKVVVLFSGGTDSLISTYLMLKRGSSPHLLFLNPKPENKESKNQILSQAQKLSKFHSELKFQTIPFKPIIEEIRKKIPKKSRKVVCERMKLFIGELVAKETESKELVSEKNLKEISSQTLKNTKIIENKVSLPILYPLLGFDEEKTEKVAEKIVSGASKKKTKICPSDFPNPEEIELKDIQEAEGNISEETLAKSALQSSEVHKIRD